jgi:hypothetical protein
MDGVATESDRRSHTRNHNRKWLSWSHNRKWLTKSPPKWLTKSHPKVTTESVTTESGNRNQSDEMAEVWSWQDSVLPVPLPSSPFYRQGGRGCFLYYPQYGWYLQECHFGLQLGLNIMCSIPKLLNWAYYTARGLPLYCTPPTSSKSSLWSNWDLYIY